MDRVLSKLMPYVNRAVNWPLFTTAAVAYLFGALTIGPLKFVGVLAAVAGLTYRVWLVQSASKVPVDHATATTDRTPSV